MSESSVDLSRIAAALKELDKVLGTIKGERTEIPFYGPTLLASLNRQDQDMALRAEQARYESNPEESAVHFCLTSAIALLEVSQVLLDRDAKPTPQDRERQWKTLVAYTKTAGRSAYRAASILTDQKNY